MGPKFKLIKYPIKDAHIRTLDVEGKGKGPDPYIKASADIRMATMKSRITMPTKTPPGFTLQGGYS